jgi:hypothetical protein
LLSSGTSDKVSFGEKVLFVALREWEARFPSDSCTARDVGETVVLNMGWIDLRMSPRIEETGETAEVGDK